MPLPRGRRLDVLEGRGRERLWRRFLRLRRAEYYPSVTGPQVVSRGYHRAMRVTLLAIGVLLVLAGLVWVAQVVNLPFAPRSFMTSERSWVLIGAITAVGGGVLIGWARQRQQTD